MKSVHEVAFAAQDTWRISSTEEAELRAWKNEMEVLRSIEIEWQDWKVALFKKLEKNSGQLWTVKLFPMLISNGVGNDKVEFDDVLFVDVVNLLTWLAESNPVVLLSSW
jgi:hypothetical protein